MKVLKKMNTAELTIKGSRFLTEAFPAESTDSVRKILKLQKEKYKNATHIVHAFVIGKQGELLGCSDNGEPAGTAGRPSLNVLKGSGITNIAVTVTRWFGGTLLGTGGLVKAYSDSVKAVLSCAETEELIEKCRFTLSCPYVYYEAVKNRLEEFNIFVINTEYSEQVKITAEISASEKTHLCSFIKETSNGTILPQFF